MRLAIWLGIALAALYSWITTGSFLEALITFGVGAALFIGLQILLFILMAFVVVYFATRKETR